MDGIKVERPKFGQYKVLDIKNGVEILELIAFIATNQKVASKTVRKWRAEFLSASSKGCSHEEWINLLLLYQRPYDCLTAWTIYCYFCSFNK